MAFTATIDIPARFKNFKAVRPASGLRPILIQWGESFRIGRISRCGDGMLRTLLYPVGKGFIRKPPERLDYLLRYTRCFPLAVVEAKAAYLAP